MAALQEVVTRAEINCTRKKVIHACDLIDVVVLAELSVQLILEAELLNETQVLVIASTQPHPFRVRFPEP